MPSSPKVVEPPARAPGPKDALIIAAWPKGGGGDAKLETEVQHAFDLVTAVPQHAQRARRRTKGAIELQVKNASFPLGAQRPRWWANSRT